MALGRLQAYSMFVGMFTELELGVMKVFAQHEQTGLYLKATPKRWLLNRDHATAFKSCWQAVQFLIEHRIRDVNLVLSNGDPEHEIVLAGFESVDIQDYGRVLLQNLLVAKGHYCDLLRKTPDLRRKIESEISNARRYRSGLRSRAAALSSVS
jgi:hypothetical protein